MAAVQILTPQNGGDARFFRKSVKFLDSCWRGWKGWTGWTDWTGLVILLVLDEWCSAERWNASMGMNVVAHGFFHAPPHLD